MNVTTQPRPRWSQLRLRQSAHIRDLLAETTFSVAQLIQPLFIVEGLSGAEPVSGLGDNARLGDAAALEQMARDLDAGVRHFLLFAVPHARMRRGASAGGDFDHSRRTVAMIKARFGDALHLWVDVCRQLLQRVLAPEGLRQ